MLINSFATNISLQTVEKLTHICVSGRKRVNLIVYCIMLHATNRFNCCRSLYTCLNTYSWIRVLTIKLCVFALYLKWLLINLCIRVFSCCWRNHAYLFHNSSYLQFYIINNYQPWLTLKQDQQGPKPAPKRQGVVYSDQTCLLPALCECTWSWSSNRPVFKGKSWPFLHLVKVYRGSSITLWHLV